MKKIIINGPFLSCSGYGEMARFALNVLREHEDKFDIFINVINWGQTGYLFEETEEYKYINFLKSKSDDYIKFSKGNPQFDLSLQITIPNEWKRMANINIGYTAGIETTVISPAWLEPSQKMDKIITLSEFSKSVFLNTLFKDDKGTQFKITTPIEVVHFPFSKKNEVKLDLNFTTDFNFLTVNQWGPRKNYEHLILSFIEEFKEENVGLVIKANIAADSSMDKYYLENKHLLPLLNSTPDRKCKIYLLHGRMSEQEIYSLYRNKNINAFVTATHGEGFGMPIFEAMQAELPIIATDWSGHLDFLSIENKKMFAKVDYELGQVQQNHVWPGVVEANSGWAFPTAQSLRSRMREVYKDHPRFKSWAKKLAQHNENKFSKDKVFADFLNALEQKPPEDEFIIL